MDEKKKRKKALYILVTTDKYELPIAVADTKAELARITGRPLNGIRSCFRANCKAYKVVEIEEEE